MIAPRIHFTEVEGECSQQCSNQQKASVCCLSPAEGLQEMQSQLKMISSET